MKVERKGECGLRKFGQVILFLDLALWIGTSAYFTLAANELFGSLPEDNAAAAVGVLFPAFFMLCVVLGVVGFVFYWWTGQHFQRKSRSYWTGFTLVGLSAVMAIVNRFVMLPQIESIEQKMGPISHASADMIQQFGMWHGISLLMEMVSLAFLCVVFMILSWNTTLKWSKGA